MGVAVRRLINSAFLTLCCASFSACGTGTSSSANHAYISISIPRASDSAASSLSTSTYNFGNACFAVNVTASDIIDQPGSGSCTIPIGIFSGFVAPGNTLSLAVPFGVNRSLEVYSYVRDNPLTPCPTQTNLGSIPKLKLVRLGKAASFDVQTADVSVAVTLAAPTENQTLASQYSLPLACSGAAAPATGSANLTPVHATISGTSAAGVTYVIQGSLTGQSNEAFLSGGNYQMHVSRRLN